MGTIKIQDGREEAGPVWSAGSPTSASTSSVPMVPQWLRFALQGGQPPATGPEATSTKALPPQCSLLTYRGRASQEVSSECILWLMCLGVIGGWESPRPSLRCFPTLLSTSTSMWGRTTIVPARSPILIEFQPFPCQMVCVLFL